MSGDERTPPEPLSHVRVEAGEPVTLPPLPEEDAPPAYGPVPLEAAPAPPLITVDVTRPLVVEVYEQAARRRGDHWRVDDREADMIAEPLAEELDEILKDAPFLGGAIEAVGSRRMRILVAVATVTAPRLIQDVTSAQARHEAALRSVEVSRSAPAPAAAPAPARERTSEFGKVFDGVEIAP